MRAIWSGAIGFGLVSIPVKLFSATQQAELDLDMLDKKDHANIKYQRVNANTGKEVDWDDIVKGYKVEDDYVVLEDKDFEKASPEKTKLIEIESFVEAEDINPMYYETSYYAEPDAKNSKAYNLLLQALKKTGKAGLGRFVLRNTESLCIIHPVENALVVSRIRFSQELRSTDDLKLPDAAISKKELDMGLALIKQYTEDFDVSKFKDEYADELMKIIKAKAKGKRPTIKKMKVAKTSSDDLYDQLMQSLNKKGA